MSTAPAGKDLSEVEALRDFGRILDRALVLARLTKQEATYLLGYANPGQISKWTTGQEATPLHRLFARLPGFKTAYMIALGEDDPAVQVVTTVTVPRGTGRRA